MIDAATKSGSQFIQGTVDIAAAYMRNHQVSMADVATVIDGIYQALVKLEAVDTLRPSAPSLSQQNARGTVFDDYLISLEDGRHYKALKRHLTRCGLTPDEYRRKWMLPANYPMVAPNHTKKRSEIAKSMGLGRLTAQAALAARAAGPRGKQYQISDRRS